MALGGFTGICQVCRYVVGGTLGGGGVGIYCFTNIESWLKFSDHMNKKKGQGEKKLNLGFYFALHLFYLGTSVQVTIKKKQNKTKLQK